MLKLARYIEHEFDRNVIFFSQAYSRASASLDFIEYIMEDTNLIKLTEEEKKYVKRIKKSYTEILSLTNQITEKIQEYKEYYQDLLLTDENFTD